MKKQFFYAAFALAMMASCTSEDNLAVDPVNPTPDGESRAGISLGLASPTVNADFGRSMGSVGDVAGEKNVWNGEKLYVAMYEKGTNTLATDPELIVEQTNPNGIIMSPSTHDFYAPKKDKNTASDSIRIYQKGSTNILDYLYYPVSGNYDFVGYHVDDLNVTFDGANRMVKGITITGQQDIMGAITKAEPTRPASLTDDDLFNDLKANWLYSARSARNKVHPTLEFKHQLARLKFFVRAGSDTTALNLKNTAGNWVPRTPIVDTDPTSTGAMYVAGIKVLDLVQNLEMNLAGTVNGQTAVTTDVAATPGKEDFKLLSRGTDGNMLSELTAEAPLYPVSLKDDEEDDPNFATTGYVTYKETPVGESIMFFPYGNSETVLNLEVQLKQYVVETENESTGEKFWDYKTYTAPVTVKATNIKNGIGETSKKFEAGNSYNIYITVYSFERIVVTAELTAWADGGDVDVDVEEDATQNQQTATYTTTIAVAYDDQAADVTPVVKINGAETTTITGTTGTSFTYEVAADGYQAVTGTSAIGDANATETITLKKLYDAVIKVTNATGTVEVKVNDEVISGTEGNYTFKAVNGGSYEFTVTDTPAEGTGEPVVKTGTIVFDKEYI